MMPYAALSVFAALSTGLLAAPAMAEVEGDVSGFGTLGAVISDSYARYQREIDNEGSVLRDSLVGCQLDVKFNEKWSVTGQLMVAAARDEDNAIAGQLKRTFVAYRPSSDWLIRLGRMSSGGLLNQEKMDVGVSYDMLRLPNEVYLASQSYDFDGLSVAKTWNTTDYEITLDLSGGFQQRDYRSYLAGSDKSDFYQADVWGGAVVLTVSDYDQKMLRLGWSYNHVEPDDPGFMTGYSRYPLPNGGYSIIPGSDTDAVDFNTLFLGLRLPIGQFTVAAEMTMVTASESDWAPLTIGGYVNLSRKFGAWTPYITYAQMYSNGDTWEALNGAVAMPAGMGTSQIDLDNMRSSLAYFDQQSVMLGASYAFTPKQKLKGEVMFTHVGDRSAMFDQLIANQIVTSYSLVYCFMF